jgi:uncharacterized membrane protein
MGTGRLEGQDQYLTEGHISRTSRHIAYIFLGLYGITLLFIGIIAAIKPLPSGQVWLDLLKSGFLILGGGLTTVIGYYFGARGIQEADERVVNALEEVNTLKEEVEKEKLKILELNERLAPTADEESLDLDTGGD